jgi:dTDP-4-dehydrorhamnose 3,5-epimerase
MKVNPTTIPDVLVIIPDLFEDERGFFMETYRAEQFREAGIPEVFVQDNHSGSIQGVLRGLHYQIKQPQGKLVRVVRGKVFEVAVDLQKSSETFGKWVGMTLTSDDKH